MSHPAPLSPIPLRRRAAPARVDGKTVEIRPAMAADLPAITEIQAESIRAGAAAPVSAPLDLRQMMALREKLVVRGYPWLVAVCGGVVVGFAFAQPFGEREAWRAAVESVVAVRAEVAGRGVGRALLAALIGTCEAKGFQQMIAVAAADAAGEAAVALHQALGFVHAGVLRGVGLRLGAPVDSLLLQRALGTAAEGGRTAA